jgi:hypothetical protein
MEWYEILILVIALSLVIYMTVIAVRIIRYKVIVENITNMIKNDYPDAKIETFKINDVYHLRVITNKEFLIKIIDMNPNHELIITNSEKVVINDDIKNWKKSTKPNFVDGIKTFIKLTSDTNPEKIVIIYPNCHNITKYINECDVYKVSKFQKVDSLLYVRYNEFQEYLKNQ